MSNAERPILNVEVGKLDPSVSSHTSLGFYLPAAGRLGLFLLFSTVLFYNPLCVLAPLRAYFISQRREAAKKTRWK